MLLDAQVEMTARVAYIIRITRITLKFHTQRIVSLQSEGFVSVIFKSSEITLLSIYLKENGRLQGIIF